MRSLSRLLLFGATALGFAFVASPSYASGQPGILINGDAGFQACHSTTGTGTTTDPYVIGPFAIASANAHADGLYAYDSWDLQIGGSAKCPQGVCNTFDYDSGWGVYLQGTTNVTIDHASANADDTGGYILDGASNTTIENSSAEAGGPICISLNGGKEPSGYFNTGLMANLMLINGAHDNTIENGTFNGFAPASGFDIAGIPNQKYFNVCTGAPSPSFVPSGTAMGSGNTFLNLCYNTSNQVPGLPPSTCKS